MIKTVWVVYFSPTGGTENVVKLVAGCLANKLHLEVKEINFTSKESRSQEYHFSDEDLVVIGSPVYAGRIPNKIMPDFRSCFKGNHTLAVPITVFGNRSFGGALTELRLILQENGFVPVGAAGIVTRHVFSSVIAVNRPDEEDRKDIDVFCTSIVRKLQTKEEFHPLLLSKDTVVEPYYTPLKEDETPAKFLPAKPVTSIEKCHHCKICVTVCPMQSIDANDVTKVTGICIKCQACIRKCPAQAKYFEDEDFLSHIRMLEQNYTARHENDYEV